MMTQTVDCDSLPTVVVPRPLAAAWSLACREVVRFLRQKNRVVGAIGQPVVFWLLFGAGLNRTFRLPGQDFRQYFAPGTLVLILLFTSIFATISLIEDRQEGFLQSVLVAPLPRWVLVAGKVGGGAFLAVSQGLLFLTLSSFVGVQFGLVTTTGLILLIVTSAIALTCVGFVIAWRLDSTQGFHAIMNLLLVPLWLLSGAFFPVPPFAEDATWGEMILHGVMRINPLTYAVSGVRQLMFGPLAAKAHEAGTEPLWLPSLPTCWLVTIGFAVLMFLIASRVARRPTMGDLL
jgi:ABC-2 type transport system permease protein